MTQVTLNGLLDYILSFDLSVRNSEWLANKIVESAKSKKEKKSLDPAIAQIPEEFRCNPYDVSPSGDPFFADRRNVEYVGQCLEEAQNEDSKGSVLNNKEDIERYFAAF